MLRHLKLTTASLAIAAFMSASALAVPGEDGPDGSDDGFEDPRTEETAPQPAPQPQPEPEPEPEPIDRTPAPREPEEPACASSIMGCPVDNPWLVRLRGIGVIPKDDTPVAGGVTDLSNTFVPELDFTYFVTDRVGFELILATSRHEVKVVDSVSDATLVDLGDVNLLPPSFTATYRWNPRGAIQPYLGLGAQLIFTYNENSSPSVDADFGHAFGPTFQAGLDYFVTENLLVNVDFKRTITDIDVKIDAVGLDESVDLDPWVVGFGVGWKF